MNFKSKNRIITLLAIALSMSLCVALVFLFQGHKKRSAAHSDELAALESGIAEELDKSNESYNRAEEEAKQEFETKLSKYDFYEKLREKLPVNVLFLGNEVTDGENTTDPNRRWVNRFVNEIEHDRGAELTGYNYGKTGSDSFYGYNVLNFTYTGTRYDLIFVCYGADEDPEDFKFYYDGLLRSIKDLNPKCEIYCIIEASPKGYGANAEAVREICAHYGGVLIDVQKYFKDNKIDIFSTVRGIEPNEEGHIHYYNCISEVLSEKIASGRRVPEGAKPHYSTSPSFDNYKIIKRAEMTRKDKTAFEVVAKGKNMILIFNRSFTDGDEFKVYINGNEVAAVDNKLDANTGKAISFFFVDGGLYGGNITVRIDTGSEDNAINLYGIAMSGVK